PQHHRQRDRRCDGRRLSPGPSRPGNGTHPYHQPSVQRAWLRIDLRRPRPGVSTHPGGQRMALINDLYLKVLTALDRDEEGQGLAEYALILALIAIGGGGGGGGLGSQVS